MKNALRNRLRSTAAVLALASIATTAHAEGVPAGTPIENTASATYTDGGGSKTVDSNTVIINVDELLDVAVVSQDSAAQPANDSAVLTFSVTNTGNGPEAFVLTADPAVTGNDFDVTIDSLAIDTNGNGIYDDGVDTLISNGATSDLIDADDSITVFVLVTDNTGAADGDTSQVNLLAEADTGTGTPGTVFANEGEGGTDAVVGATGADDDALGDIIKSLATVTLTKSATISDPFGGNQPIPGATITYSLVASVSGSGPVTGMTVNDDFPADTTYVTSTITLEGGGLTDASDTDAGEASATGISVDLGDLAAGDTRTVTFNVTIDN